MTSRILFCLGILAGALIALMPAYLLVQQLAPDFWNNGQINDEDSLQAAQGPPLAEEDAAAEQRREALRNHAHNLQRSIRETTLVYARIAAQLNQGKAHYQAALRQDDQDSIYLFGKTYSNLERFKTELEQLYTERNIVETHLDGLWSKLTALQQAIHALESKGGMPAIPSSKMTASESSASDHLDFVTFLHLSDPVGYIDWQNHWIYVVSEAPLRDEVQSRQQALQLATIYLHATLDKLWINSETRIDQLASRNAALKAKISALLSNVQVVEEWYGEDGSIQLLVRFSLHGQRGLEVALVPLELSRLARMTAASPQPTPVPTKAAYTGLIVDARGLKAAPGLFPRILTHSGRIIYDLSRIDPNALVRRGLCIYGSSLAALWADLHTGANPLIVSAVEATGTYPMDLLVDDQVGDATMAADQQAGFLREARVAIVID